MKVNAFITHKKAEQFIDCQDRFSVNCDTKSIALSDGMGSTWQQKIWARILVTKFTQSESLILDQNNVKELSDDWYKSVYGFIEKLKLDNAQQNIIYRNERNLAGGMSAGATFVGVRLVDKRWKGNVLGDSCLIVWDEGNANFFTSQNTDEFDSFPDYFDSNKQKHGRGTPKNIDIEVKENETILLVSDPFSDFLLERKKEGAIKQYISKLINLNSHEEFENLVEEWRILGMHNDDTTLIVVKHSSDSSNLEEGIVDDIEKEIEREEKEREIRKEAERNAKEEAERNAKETVERQNENQENKQEQTVVIDDVEKFLELIKEELITSVKNIIYSKNFKKLRHGDKANVLVSDVFKCLKREFVKYKK